MSKKLNTLFVFETRNFSPFFTASLCLNLIKEGWSIHFKVFTVPSFSFRFVHPPESLDSSTGEACAARNFDSANLDDVPPCPGDQTREDSFVVGKGQVAILYLHGNAETRSQPHRAGAKLLMYLNVLKFIFYHYVFRSNLIYKYWN